MDDEAPEGTNARESGRERHRLQRRTGVERARELVRQYIEGTPSMAEELLAERRAEAKKDGLA